MSAPTPATPLPWMLDAATGADLVWGAYRIVAQVGDGESYRPEDTAYIVHAANGFPELLWFAQQIFNGLDTGMLKIESPADETLANILQRGRAAIAKATQENEQ